MKKFIAVFCLILVNLSLQGCGTLAVGTALFATGAAATRVFTDRRSAEISELDDNIIQAIQTALEKDKTVATQARIKFLSYNRIVLLAGEAPSDAVRQQAIKQILDHVPNIRKIHNEIHIAPLLSQESREYDSNLRIRITAALVGKQFFNASHVHMTLSNRTVYVMGLLSREEADAAIDTIRRVDGVKKVIPLIEYVKLIVHENDTVSE
ncbi:BON domain-containing protein [Candidatus Venteria ishoeyi]|uniref:Outer membrane lipoprotein n=1 Tax=Candidatus Venteria ishoeyi TaxID=1899563 RepID=A0A1H6F7E1_9GAMM|nr:BON domain-containing protein [Candidatus Venteria ishoeyi]MDM8545968.1 BON domain-containing protein [Candidatus Venteria ishoeyi]SEH06058.1 outer membrane lipoprotein [Candidatus Venteria ishoeyi]